VIFLEVYRYAPHVAMITARLKFCRQLSRNVSISQVNAVAGNTSIHDWPKVCGKIVVADI
jgi:hypothetical protein